mmetsp:Transcript_77343/g.136402  ORF Transcript_77343/g.136402 Transcript_77343/m.136402 type:complete len:337 (+) Transcript_77343:371-1381(+)
MSVTAIITCFIFLEGRVARAAASPSRSSAVVCLVLGTNFRRRPSSAACKDHARVAGNVASFLKIAGDGPTVLTVHLDCGKENLRWSVRASRALPTLLGLQPASPIPMNTMFVSGGMASRCASRRPWNTCDRISSAVRFWMSPILPVAQKMQPRLQPTWDDTQRVVRGRTPWGMRTLSISCSEEPHRCRNLSVPHDERVSEMITVLAMSSEARHWRRRARAGAERPWPSATSKGLSPIRSASHTDWAFPFPPNCSANSSSVMDMSASIAGSTSGTTFASPTMVSMAIDWSGPWAMGRGRCCATRIRKAHATAARRLAATAPCENRLTHRGCEGGASG